MKEVSVTHVVSCPLCHKTGEVTISSDGRGPRRVEMEHICEHLDPEYEERARGIRVYFTHDDGWEHVFLLAPLAIFVDAGDPHLVARALRRRGFKVRVDGRYIVFEAHVYPYAVERALQQYMLATARTVSYQFVQL